MSVEFINKTIELFESKSFDKAIEYNYDNIQTVQKIYNSCNSPIIKYPFSLKLLNKLISKHKKSSDANLQCDILRQLILGLVVKKRTDMMQEEEELKSPKTKIKYVLNIANDQVKKKLFFLYLVTYEFEVSNQKNKFFLGIDYEFTKRVIALMQLNFETSTTSKLRTFSYLWIVNPGEFDKIQMDLLINKLMRNQKIIKILHGSDSLDFPYMFEIMFDKNKAICKDFTNSFIDTRYLCEYYKVSIGDMEKKCAIYEALLYFETINQDKYQYLLDSHDNMGPVQDVQWDIYKMSSYHTKYALYDVLFLKHFLFDIYRKGKQDTPNIFKSYKYIINLVRFTFLEKKEVTTLTKISKLEVDPMNNYLIKKNKDNFTLISIYNKIIENLKIEDINLDLNLLFRINYIKSTITLLFKRIIYGLILTNFRVFKNKKETVNTELRNDKIFELLKEEKLDMVFEVAKLFEQEARNKIILNYK
ncbi:MAG: hypothetical protein CMF62_02105 [Magnetococcales bacterium]|nr:hypothetical protein [Magnetococcales bacterium]|tara:strand:- start:157697 stop:159118 length:1422 start_codon:yes stop_codon:yes gene_type:complete